MIIKAIKTTFLYIGAFVGALSGLVGFYLFFRYGWPLIMHYYWVVFGGG